MSSPSTYRSSLRFGSVGALLAAALLGYGWAAVLQAAPEKSPRQLAQTAAAKRVAARTKPARQYDTPFAEAMVRDKVEWNYLGKQTIDIALINATRDADLKATARACLDHFLPGHQFAQCYVFASLEEYRYKHVSSQVKLPKGTPAIGLTIFCYAVLGRQEPGKPANIANMRDAQIWHAQGCPGW